MNLKTNKEKLLKKAVMTTGLAVCAYNCTISEVKTDGLDIPSSRTGRSKFNSATYPDPIFFMRK